MAALPAADAPPPAETAMGSAVGRQLVDASAQACGQAAAAAPTMPATAPCGTDEDSSVAGAWLAHKERSRDVSLRNCQSCCETRRREAREAR